MLKVLDQNEILLAYLENAKDVCVQEKLNDEFLLSFWMPRDDTKFAEIETERFIDCEGQLFVIRTVDEERSSDGKLGASIECEHVYTELLDEYQEAILNFAGTTAEFALTQILQGTRFTIGTVSDFGLNDLFDLGETNKLDCIQQIKDIWGGEFEFNNRQVNLLAQRGQNTGVRFEYTKNLKSIKRTTDSKNVVTRLFGYGKDGLTIEGFDTTTLTAQEQIDLLVGVTKDANGIITLKYIDSPYITNYKRPKNGKFESDIEDQKELLKKMQEYRANNEIPYVTYEVEMLELKKLVAQHSAYVHEIFGLGDTITVIDKPLGISVTSRILEYEYYPYEPQMSKVVLANFRQSLTDILGDFDTTKQVVDQSKSAWDRAKQFNPNGTLSTQWLIGAIAAATNAIVAGTNNCVETNGDGITIYDPTDQFRLKRMRINTNAIAVSVDGGASYRTAMTNEGLVADLITSGKILTSLVRIEGDTNFYWDGSALYCVDPADPNRQIRINKEGLKLTADGGINWNNALTHDGLAIGPSTPINGVPASTITARVTESYNFINATYPADIASLQSQIDGNITTWFYGYEPTLNNLPTGGWTTEALRNQHLGDLFYNTLTGYAYRFQLVNSVYSWARITDTDITTALANAQKAQDTADGKRRVFVAQPIPPYDVGDLWSQGTTSDLMRCKVARATGSYVAADWEKASKYTDDTAANAAASAASAAQTSANTANAEIANMSSDDKISPVEKISLKKDWDAIVAEKSPLDTQATTYSITAEKTTYDNAYNTLNTYMNTTKTVFANMTTTTDLGTGGGATIRSNFASYYTAKVNLLNAITTATVPNPNLLRNGGAEIYTGSSGTNIPDGWYWWQPSTVCTFTRRVNDANYTIRGNASFEIRTTDTTANSYGRYYQNVPVVAGKTYTMSALVTSLRCNSGLRFEFLNSSGGLISALNGTTISNTTPSPLTLTATIPANCVTLVAVLDKGVTTAGQTSSYLFADNVKLEKGSIATPFTETDSAVVENANNSVQQGTAYNSVAITPTDGVKATHPNGDYTQMYGGGFFRHTPSGNKDYHYLTATGTGATITNGYPPAVPDNTSHPASVTVTLPAEFKGKDFSKGIALSVKETTGYTDTYFQALVLRVDSIDIANGTFVVSAWQDFWSYGHIYTGVTFTYVVVA